MPDRITFTVTLGDLAAIPGTPYSYWAPKSLRDMFQTFPPLDRDVAGLPDESKLADVKQGLATAEDTRFSRYWWEIAIEQIATDRAETHRGMKWVPYAKSANLFYDDVLLLVNWGRDGEEVKDYILARYPYLDGKWQWVAKNDGYYFLPGLRCSRAQSWSSVAQSGRLAASVMPKGVIFGARTMAVVPKQAFFQTLGLLLARTATALVYLQCGEPAGEISHIARIPVVPGVISSSVLALLVKEGHDLLQQHDTGNEISTHFVAPWLHQVRHVVYGTWDEHAALITVGHPLARDFGWSGWESAKRIRALKPTSTPEGRLLFTLAQTCVERERLLRQRIAEIQRQIDDEVYRLYGINDADQALIETELGQATVEADEGAVDSVEDESAGASSVEGLMPAEEHIRRLVHYLAHECIKEDPDGIVPVADVYTSDGRLERGLAQRVRNKLTSTFGAEHQLGIEQEIKIALGMTLDDWLATEFFSYHTGLYRLRPILWQIASQPRGQSAFACFVYWLKLDVDTLRKVQELYLRPVLESAQREVDRTARRFAELQQSGAGLQNLRSAEKEWKQAGQRHGEMRDLHDAIQKLLQPQTLKVESRSAWVVEKVNEIVAQGYRPERDYGVRVNIEPLKQAGILPVAAARVKG